MYINCFKVTKAGNLILYRHQPYGGQKDTRRVETMSQAEAAIDIKKVKLKHRHSYSGRPDNLSASAIKSLRDKGVNTFGELVTAASGRSFLSMIRSESSYCSDFTTIVGSVCRDIRERAPAVVDASFVPPVFVDIGGLQLRLDGDNASVGEAWESMPKKSKDGVIGELKLIMASNLASLLEEADKKFREKEIERLKVEMKRHQDAIKSKIKSHEDALAT